MRLVLLPDARRDILDSIQSFDDLSIGLGGRFEDELFACFDRIKSNPDRYAENANGFRASKLNRFQAVVYFRAETNRLTVFRVCVNGRKSDGVENGG